MVDVNSLLTVKDLIKDEPVYVGPDSNILDVAKIMRENKVDGVLVKDETGHMSGIISKLDVIYKVVAEDKAPAEVNVTDIMTKNLITIDGGESMFKARQVMLDNNVKHLVVTNDDKQLGVVTAVEILGEK